MDRYKKNEAIKVNYIVLKKTLGLTDVYMQPYDEAGVIFGSPILMTEIPGDGSGLDSGGAYQGSFTPDANGQWRIRIQSTVNGDDIQRVFEVGNYKLDDVKDQTDDIEGKIDVIDGNVTSVKSTVETTDGKVDTVISDVAAVKGVVDGIVTDVAAVKGVVDGTDGKVDNLDSDVAAVKGVVDGIKTQTQSIEDKVDDIDLQIDKGGYIL